ncbi:hypothetical protein MPL3356_40496 [Mesorhizobium plurifarium]|uniref:Uncharacterized protein n=1 Tax=Mesorhizobium plurifarium TaxID=69974 RepID=A0A090E8S7_MESPL|nr:hypothetical protein MPL3356_40496 [Mesorhizobium plurifarium]
MIDRILEVPGPRELRVRRREEIAVGEADAKQQRVPAGRRGGSLRVGRLLLGRLLPLGSRLTTEGDVSRLQRGGVAAGIADAGDPALHLGPAPHEIPAGIEEAPDNAAGGASALPLQPLDRGKLAPQLRKLGARRVTTAGHYLPSQRRARIGIRNLRHRQDRRDHQEWHLKEPQPRHRAPPLFEKRVRLDRRRLIEKLLMYIKVRLSLCYME